eukprot:4031884-Prymnesium_polylepis.1
MGPDGLLKICALAPPPAKALPTRYDAAWPLTKLPLRATPHVVVPLPAHDAILVGTSTTTLKPDEPLPLEGADGTPLTG